jgi:hypothetical protein
MIQAGGKTTTKTTLAKRFVLVIFWHSCVRRLRGVVPKTILRNWWWRCSVAAPYTIFEKFKLYLSPPSVATCTRTAHLENSVLN